MKLHRLDLNLAAAALLCCSILTATQVRAAYEIDGGSQSETVTNSVSTNTVYVGRYNSDNSLTLSNGGMLDATTVNVGHVEPSGNNTLLVTGSNTLLQATKTLSAGAGGTGNALTAQNGAWVVVGQQNLGVQTNVAAGGIIVGNSDGSALLSLKNGSVGTAENLYAGIGASDGGKIELAGTDTRLDIANNFYLGYAGSSNTLTLSSGATLSVSNLLQVGSLAGKQNIMNINNGGKAIVIGTLDIIAPGTNSINIANGGHLAVSQDFNLDTAKDDGFNFKTGATLETGGILTAGPLDSGLKVILNGSLGTNTASWNTGGDEMYVGQATANNTITIQDGASATAGGTTAHIGEGTSSSGNSVTVTGSNSTFTVAGKIFVGEAGDNNKLIVKDGASATIATSLTVGQTSAARDNQLTITGTNALLTTGGNVTIGKLGSSNDLFVQDEASLVVGGSLILGDDAVASANTMTISGSNTTVSVANDLVLGSASINNRYTQTGGTNTVAGAFVIGKTEDATGKTGFVDNNRVETTGNLAIVGDASTLNIGQDLTVGQEGGGSILTIRDGGTVNVAGDTIIGEAVGDNYIYLQRDADTRFNVTGDLIVGKEGGDNRFAAYGGTANIDGNLYLGSTTNQHVEKNFIHIETTNAVLNVANAIHIGASNSVNTLDLAAGATVNAQDLFVGAYAGVSNNVVTVTGSKSLLSISNSLTLGSNTGSNNAINVNNGGTLFVGGNIDIGAAATNDLNNRLNINSGGTLQTLDWDFATISSNLLLHSGSTLEVGGSLTGTNQVENGIEIAINSGIATNNAVWDSGTNSLYVGRDTANNTLSVFGGGSVVSGSDLVIGFGSNSHDNAVFVYGSNSTLSALNDIIVGLNGHDNALTITNGGNVTAIGGDLVIGSGTNSHNNTVGVYGSNSTLNVGNNLIVGSFGNNNLLSITNGATVNIASNAWLGLASSGNTIEINGTNASLVVGNDLFIGSTNQSFSGNTLGVYDTASLFVGGGLTLANGNLEIEYNAQVNVAGNYAQDEFSALTVRISTNSVSTNLVVGGSASFAKDSTIAVYSDGTIPALVEGETTNKIGRTIVAAGSLEIDGQDATTALLDSDINFQLNALLEFNYSVTNNSIYLDNFIKRSWAEAGNLDGMVEAVANEIELNMLVASNELALAMDATFQDGMTGQEIGKAMNDYYGEKESASPTHNLINQGIIGCANQLTVRGDSTRARMEATAAPAGAAGPYSAGQELQGWVSGFGTRFDKSAADGFGAYDGSTRGFLIGADLSVAENILVGIAGGSGNSNVDKDNGASSDAKTTYGAIYASVGTQDWFADASVIYGGSSIDSTLGTVFDTTANYDAQNMAIYFGGGKEIIGDYLIITPQASLLANYYKQDAYEEKSTTAVTRSVDSFDALYLQSSIGCNLGIYMGLGETTLKPELRAHWLHEFNASEETINYGLIGGTGNYSMLLQAPEEDILKLGVGLSAKMSEYLELRADLDTRQGSDYSDYTVLGSIRYQF